MSVRLPVLNLEEAKFECTFGRGCEGDCCREGRPLIYADEIDRIDAILPRLEPLLRPEARRVLHRVGYLTRRRRLKERLARNAGGWCIFFNRGCTLHRLGADDGDELRYKPAVCALFPIQKDEHDNWYVRQKGYKRERWNLWCLDPAATTVSAAQSLAAEVALAQRFSDESALE